VAGHRFGMLEHEGIVVRTSTLSRLCGSRGSPCDRAMVVAVRGRYSGAHNCAWHHFRRLAYTLTLQEARRSL
jgi:hypothetical protein